ncbi:UNVERIFIED_CONTAM: hypothetical protein FKN15_018074 [Acipenser sinensis]
MQGGLGDPPSDSEKEDELWEKVDSVRHKLTRILNPAKLTPYLRQCKAIDEQDEEEVLNSLQLPLRINRAGRLVDILRQKGRRGYDAFMESLEFYHPDFYTNLTGREPTQRCSIILDEEGPEGLTQFLLVEVKKLREQLKESRLAERRLSQRCRAVDEERRCGEERLRLLREERARLDRLTADWESSALELNRAKEHNYTLALKYSQALEEKGEAMSRARELQLQVDLLKNKLLLLEEESPLSLLCDGPCSELCCSLYEERLSVPEETRWGSSKSPLSLLCDGPCSELCCSIYEERLSVPEETRWGSSKALPKLQYSDGSCANSEEFLSVRETEDSEKDINRLSIFPFPPCAGSILRRNQEHDLLLSEARAWSHGLASLHVLELFRVTDLPFGFDYDPEGSLHPKIDIRSEKLLLFDNMQNELMEKIQRLEEDRQTIDISSEVSLSIFSVNSMANVSTNLSTPPVSTPDLFRCPVAPPTTDPGPAPLLQKGSLAADITIVGGNRTGVFVSGVKEGSRAEQCGLKEGCQLLEVTPLLQKGSLAADITIVGGNRTGVFVSGVKEGSRAEQCGLKEGCQLLEGRGGDRESIVWVESEEGTERGVEGTERRETAWCGWRVRKGERGHRGEERDRVVWVESEERRGVDRERRGQREGRREERTEKRGGERREGRTERREERKED